MVVDPAGGEVVRRDAQDDDDRCREPGFPAALGDPHPDSVVIESAVKHLGDWAGYRFADERMDAVTRDIPLSADPALIAAESIAAARRRALQRRALQPRIEETRPMRPSTTGRRDNGTNGSPPQRT